MTPLDLVVVALGVGAFVGLCVLLVKATRDAKRQPQNWRH